MKIISIKNIVFYNIESHYCIFKDSEDLTYQGNLFYPYKKQKIEIDYSTIKTAYGEQFKIGLCNYFLPETEEQIVNFLSSGLISNIGDKTAKKIFNIVRNKESLFNNLEDYLKQLNLNAKLSNNLANKLKLYKNFVISNLEFSKIGFSQDSIIKIIQLFGSNSISILKSNPYEFYKKIPLVTFEFLDKVASTFELSLVSKERILAGAMSYIEEYCNDNKSSGISFDNLFEQLYQFLKIDDGICYATLNHLIDEKKLCEIEIDNNLLISTPQIFYTEMGISNNIKRLNIKIKKQNFDYNKIPEFLSEKQKKAIISLLENKISILTGMPGTGKTTIIKYAVSIFKESNNKKIIHIGTPTGKAAQRVKEMDNSLSVSTNHKMLGFLPNGEFIHNEKNKLNYDLLILDESSMIDIFMFHDIVKSLPDDARLWIIGDSNQLPSINLGNVLLDLISSKLINHYQLTEVFRQKSNSNILNNAINVINKESVVKHENKPNLDFYFFHKTEEKEIVASTLDLYFKIIKNKELSINEIQILCPQKTGLCGVDNINKSIQSVLFNGNNSIKWKEKVFYIGDKVIQTINDYEKDIFNGDVGYIKNISINSYQIVVSFVDREVVFEKSEIDQLELAYALTIHKFQGSETNTIIMPIAKSFYRMLTPKLIYTGMTRAKNLLVMNGDIYLFNKALKSNLDVERKTFLQHFLQN